MPNIIHQVWWDTIIIIIRHHEIIGKHTHHFIREWRFRQCYPIGKVIKRIRVFRYVALQTIRNMLHPPRIGGLPEHKAAIARLFPGIEHIFGESGIYPLNKFTRWNLFFQMEPDIIFGEALLDLFTYSIKRNQGVFTIPLILGHLNKQGRLYKFFPFFL